MNQINLPLTENVFDFFKKNLDPDVLRDRMNQAARTRDAAREAAKIAEKKGNQALADQLNQDADNLQRLIDETIAQANSVQHPTKGNDSAGSPKADKQDGEDANAESPEEVEDSEETTSDSKKNQEDTEDDEDSASDSNSEPDGEDSEEDDEGDSAKSTRNTGNADGSSQSNKQNSSEEADQNEMESGETNKNTPNSDETEESEESEESGESDADLNAEDEDEESDQANDSRNDGSGGDSDDEDDWDEDEDGEGDGEGSADDDSDEENDFGPPKIEDKKILQNPFKSNQIPSQLPKSLQQQIENGELEIESEEDAIVRIISKLSGEARKGAEKALRDVYEQIKPSWWGAIDEG